MLGVLKGLSEDSLRRPVPPSGWSCLGLVRHLGVDDERFWFRGVAAGGAVDLNETAIHAGHLAAARELLDGRTWMGPEDTPVPRG